MAKGYLICKVCGEKYPYCMTNVMNAFRWQDVACCEEHAKIYFDLVEKARTADAEQSEAIVVDEPEAEPKSKPRRTSKKKTAAE